MDPLAQGMKKIEGGIDKGTDVMKEAATHQVEALADATSAFGKGIKKSIKRHSKEMRGFARSFSELVDVEDILKSIHKVAYPSDHAKSTSIIHPPIDWSKYPPGSVIPPPQNIPPTCTEESPECEQLPVDPPPGISKTSTDDDVSLKPKPKIASRHSAPATHSKDYVDQYSTNRCQGNNKDNLDRGASFNDSKGSSNHVPPAPPHPSKEYVNRPKVKVSPRTSKDYSDPKLKYQLECHDENNLLGRRHSRDSCNGHTSASKAPLSRSSSTVTRDQYSSVMKQSRDYPTPSSTTQSKAPLNRSATVQMLDPQSPSKCSSKVYTNHSGVQRSSSMRDPVRLSTSDNQTKILLNRTASLQQQPRILSTEYSPSINYSTNYMEAQTATTNSPKDYLDVHSSCRKHSREKLDEISSSDHPKSSSLSRSSSVRQSKANSSSTQQTLPVKSRMCTRSSSMRVAKKTAYV